LKALPAPKDMKVPPQSLESEMAILGAMVMDNGSISEVSQMLKAEDFYKTGHGLIFKSALEIHEQGNPVDLVSLSNMLKENGGLENVGGIQYLMSLADNVPTSANIEYYAKTVRNASKIRKAINFMYGKLVDVFQTPLEEADSFLDGLSSGSVMLQDEERANPVEHISKPMKRLVDRYSKMQEKGGLTGITTGLTDLDSALTGWQNADLIVIAARPSIGKTALAIEAAGAAAMVGIPPLVFSLEMSNESLVQRMLAEKTGEAHSRLRAASRNVNWSRVLKAADLLSKAPIHLDDTASISVSELKAKARMMCIKEGVGLVIIDYLQLMIQGTAKRHEELGMITKALKALAKERKIPVILLSQLNRNLEMRPDKRPILSDLRESGEIEEDSDVVLFLYRDEKYCPDCKKSKECEKDHKGLTEIIIGKNRNGPTWTVGAMFDEKTVSFRNLEKERAEEWKPYKEDDGGNDQ